jgi:Na+-transporting NADH:ubiquinone oxidoreductase subunit D
LMGFKLIPDSAYGMGYADNGMMTMSAMALIILGCIIAIHRYINRDKDIK